MKKILLFAILSFILLSFTSDDNDVLWNSRYKLKWSDFRGTNTTGSRFKAISVIYIRLEGNEDDDKFNIVAGFDRNESWTLSSTETLLAHEQLHFDITEYYARKLRKIVGDSEDYDFASKAYDQIDVEMDKEQSLYDLETKHSIDKVKQQEWSERVQKELKSLEKYAK